MLNYIPYPTYLTCVRDLRDLLAYVLYVLVCLMCLRAFLFLRALSAIIFYVPYVLSFSYGPYVSSIFMCLTCLSIFLYGFTCFLEECGGIFQMTLMVLLRFLICCHQQHNAKSPQNLNKSAVNGKTCKIDNLIFFTTFSNPKFLYLHLKTFTEKYSDE